MASDATAPLDQYLRPIKDHARLIGVVAAGITLLGVLASALVPTSYQATASVLVTPISTDPSETFESDVVVDMPTEERIATSKTVVAQVSDRLAQQSIDIGHEALALNVSVSSPEESRILDVSYQAATPTLAQTGADTFAQVYLDYRSQLADENKSATEDALRERVTLLKDQLAGVQAELARYEEGSQSYVTLSVEQESIKSELNAQQDTMAQLSTLSTDVGRIISPAELPASARGLGPFVIILGALVSGIVLGCLAAYAWATLKAAGAPRNRRATDSADDAGHRPEEESSHLQPAEWSVPTEDYEPASMAPATSPAGPSEAENGSGPPSEPEADTISDPELDSPPLTPILPVFTGEPTPPSEPDAEPAGREHIDAQPAYGGRTHVAEPDAMDAFFGPEPEAADEQLEDDEQLDYQLDYQLDGQLDAEVSIAHEPMPTEADGIESDLNRAWDTGFLEQSLDPAYADPHHSTEPAGYPLEPASAERDDESEPVIDPSLDAVAAETNAVLAELLTQPPSEAIPVGGSEANGNGTSPPPPERPNSTAEIQYDVDRSDSGWEMDDDIGPWDHPEEPGDTGLEAHPVPSEPPPPPAPPAPISDADFKPLLQRLRHIGQGRSVSCVCLGEASRDASLAIGFGLADELQSLGVSVLVVDMLLEEPALDRLLGLPAQPGLLDVLAEQTTLDEAARGIDGLGQLRALPVGKADGRVDRRRTNELINGWSMQRLLDDVGASFHATVIIGGTLDDARRLSLVLQQTDGVVVGTEQVVGETANGELNANLAGLPAEVLALVSVDAALSAAEAAGAGAGTGAPSM